MFAWLGSRSEKKKVKISELDLLAIKTLAGTGVFVVTSIVCIQLIARNNPISEGVTIFASGFFALILAVLGVNGWQAIQKRKTEWEPSQEVKDQIQLARMMKPPDNPVVQPFVPVNGSPNITTEMPVPGSIVDPGMRRAVETFEARTREAGAPDDGAVG
jgi:hypothetical protein